MLEALREFPRYAEVDIAELVSKVDALDLNREINMKKIEKVAAAERSPRLRENLDAVRRIRERVAA